MDFLARVEKAVTRIRTRITTALADRNPSKLQAAIAARDATLERVTGVIEGLANEVDGLFQADAQAGEGGGDDDPPDGGDGNGNGDPTPPEGNGGDTA